MAPRALALTLGAAFLSATGASGAEVEDARARGLGADDACGAEADPGSCAVSALQRNSNRGGASADAARGKDSAEHRREGGDDDEWVWSRDILDEHMRTSRYDGDTFWTQLTDIFAPRMVQHCLRYNAYFWPQTSFWSQEVLRRVEALPEELDAAQQRQLQAFSRNASWLMCNFWFDPRQGTNWSQPVAEYMNKVRAMPSSSLEMPRLEGSFFESLDTRDNMWSGDSCMYWASNLMCDVGHLSRDLSGSKDLGGDLCWDQVDIPTDGFSVFGVSLQPGRVGTNDSDADYVHPEYSKCQEKPLDKDVLSQHCPMFGHYPSGYMNVSYWGTPQPKGSDARAEVLTCEKKLGIPKTSPPTYSEVTHFPWDSQNGGVNLMSPPPAGWKPKSFFDMDDARVAFTHAVRDAVVPALTPNCNGGDWLCIVKTLDNERRKAEAESGIITDIPGNPSPIEIHDAMKSVSSSR